MVLITMILITMVLITMILITIIQITMVLIIIVFLDEIQNNTIVRMAQFTVKIPKQLHHNLRDLHVYEDNQYQNIISNGTADESILHVIRHTSYVYYVIRVISIVKLCF